MISIFDYFKVKCVFFFVPENTDLFVCCRSNQPNTDSTNDVRLGAGLTVFQTSSRKGKCSGNLCFGASVLNEHIFASYPFCLIFVVSFLNYISLNKNWIYFENILRRNCL